MESVEKNSELSILTVLFNWIFLHIWKPCAQFFSPTPFLTSVSKTSKKAKPTSSIPGPYEWPLLGDAVQMNKLGGPKLFLNYISNLHEKYGSIFKVKLGPSKFVFINSPTLYQEAARFETKCPTPATFKIPASEAFMKKYQMKRGLFFQNGKDWVHGRHLLTQAILKDTGRFQEQVFEPVPTIMEKFIAKMASKRDKNLIVDNIEQLCYECFMSSIMAITFGRNYETYLKEIGLEMPQMAKMAMDLNAITFDVNAVPIGIATALGIQSWKTYQEMTMTHLTTGQKMTDMALKDMEDKDGGSLEEFGLVHRFKYDIKADVEDIRIHCTDFALDINDAVSATMMWSLQALGRNKDVQDKILEEVQRVCDPSEPITYKDVQQMPYVNATYKEVMRLYPAASLIIRVLPEAAIIGGYTIPPEYNLALSSFHSHRNPEYFPEPERLWPERWLEMEGDSKKLASENAYLPFGFGKRFCVGKVFVHPIVKIFISTIVRNFIIESEEVDPMLCIILLPDRPLQIKLTPRK